MLYYQEHPWVASAYFGRGTAYVRKGIQVSDSLINGEERHMVHCGQYCGNCTIFQKYMQYHTVLYFNKFGHHNCRGGHTLQKFTLHTMNCTVCPHLDSRLYTTHMWLACRKHKHAMQHIGSLKWQQYSDITMHALLFDSVTSAILVCSIAEVRLCLDNCQDVYGYSLQSYYQARILYTCICMMHHVSVVVDMKLHMSVAWASNSNSSVVER